MIISSWIGREGTLGWLIEIFLWWSLLLTYFYLILLEWMPYLFCCFFISTFWMLLTKGRRFYWWNTKPNLISISKQFIDALAVIFYSSRYHCWLFFIGSAVGYEGNQRDDQLSIHDLSTMILRAKSASMFCFDRYEAEKLNIWEITLLVWVIIAGCFIDSWIFSFLSFYSSFWGRSTAPHCSFPFSDRYSI